MKYLVSVVMSYWQNIQVEADSEDQAKSLAMEQFDQSKSVQGEGEVHDIAQMES